MKTVLGLVGEIGSGKSTFVRIVEELIPETKIAHFKSSDILAAILEILNKPATRKNLQKLPEILSELFDDDVISEAIFARISQSDADICVFDGVRWPSDVEVLRRFPNNFLIYITADARTRYSRVKSRKDKLEEADLTFAQFLQADLSQTEIFIPKIGENADIKISSGDTIDSFFEDIKNFVEYNLKTADK